MDKLMPITSKPLNNEDPAMNTVQTSGIERLQFMGNRVMVKALKLAVGVMPIRDPKLLVGANATDRLAETIAGHSLSKVLLVTTAGIVKRGQADELIRALELRGIASVIFDGILPDPTFDIVNAGLDLLQQETCDGVVALGGGSAMDAAKVIAVAAANNRAPEKLVGYFKGFRKPLPLYAVPTTAGTGSEATIASVISDDRTHAKSFIIDSRMVPLAAALQPRLMEPLSPSLTAATGMDALTHAIEAYISTISTSKTNRYAEEAIKLIFEFLPRACDNGSDLEAREAMSIASYKAGRAFTQASVGYVHAISHQLGAHYGTPHGLGNAIVLPEVLEFSKAAAGPKLARLAVAAGLGNSSELETDLAQKFVDHIRKLNRQLAIPTVVAELEENDIPGISRGALKEALLNYPVPRQMGRVDCEELLRGLLTAHIAVPSNSVIAAV
jgi:alcohol dehydrogenase class IV